MRQNRPAVINNTHLSLQRFNLWPDYYVVSVKLGDPTTYDIPIGGIAVRPGWSNHWMILAPNGRKPKWL